MPAWIHSRAEHLLAKNPDMPKGQAFAIATQQSHAVGKSPKSYGTVEGRARAALKYPTPKDDKKTANPGGLTSSKLAGAVKVALVERLARLALTDVPSTPRLLMRKRSPMELGAVQQGVENAFERWQGPAREKAQALAGRLLPEGRARGVLTRVANLAIDNPEIVPMQALPIPGLTPAYLGAKKGLEHVLDRVSPRKLAFAASTYSAPLNPVIRSGASDLPPFKAPQLRAALQKVAEGAPTAGGFAMASDVPGFRVPNLRTGLQKAGDMLPENITYNASDFKPVRFTKRGAAALSPAGRLAQTKSVGMPKLTAPSGPSIADIAKPKGPGFGTGIAGAFKGTIGGTAGSQYK